MVMQLELQQTAEQGYAEILTTKVSWRLIAANRILQQSSQELQQSVAIELDANPALELVDVEMCRACGSEMLGSICPHCIQCQKEAPDVRSADASYANDEPPEERTRLLEDEDFDRFTRVVSELTLGQRLLLDMGAELPTMDMPIAEYLVGSLDDRGYLPIKPSEVANHQDVSEDRVNDVVAVLQAQEPVGIGTRNLRACLLLQVERLAERGLQSVQCMLTPRPCQRTSSTLNASRFTSNSWSRYSSSAGRRSVPCSAAPTCVTEHPKAATGGHVKSGHLRGKSRYTPRR